MYDSLITHEGYLPVEAVRTPTRLKGCASQWFEASGNTPLRTASHQASTSLILILRWS